MIKRKTKLILCVCIGFISFFLAIFILHYLLDNSLKHNKTGGTTGATGGTTGATGGATGATGGTTGATGGATGATGGETGATGGKNIPNCKTAKQMNFSDITGSKQCNIFGTNSKPAYIIFIRHCDRGYKDSSSCQDKNDGTCYGCQYPEAEGGCATNDCSDEGIKRSWNIGKWVNCFANDKGLKVTGVISQIFIRGKTNQRPTTTASIIYESLMNLGHSPCYISSPDDNNIVKNYATSDNFNGQILVIVWDHSKLPVLINTITGHTSYWDPCCFDKVAVVDKINIEVYDTKSLSQNDQCGTSCDSKNKIYKNCYFSNFGDLTPCKK
jgi:hypothetical protein